MNIPTISDSSLNSFKELLDSSGISYESDNTTTYMSDASFLTLGKPGLVIFPYTEEQVVTVVGYAAVNSIPLTPRAKGSSTAGASIAPAGCAMMITDRLGVANKFGKRLGKKKVEFYTKEGELIQGTDLSQFEDEQVYARVGAGLSTEELDKYLSEFGWHTAVVPSSGWSTIGGNFSTNAGGNGTPKYGTFKHIINRVRIVTSREDGAEIRTVTDKDTIVEMGGGQGLYGILTELDIRVIPDLAPEETLCAVCHATDSTIEGLGNSIGNFMSAMQKVCDPEIAEFMMLDKGILSADDPLYDDPEISPLLSYPDDQFKMITMYMGKKDDLKELKPVADSHDGIEFTEISLPAFRKMLNLRKAATGKSPGRVALPGFEDIYVQDPKYLGKVLSAIFKLTDGRLPGRPIGHQYTGGVVIHYRPQASANKEEYASAWQLTQELTSEICSEDYQTIKRQEHGLGLEVYSLAAPDERDKILRLKDDFDPANIFQPHFISDTPEINFLGEYINGFAD